MPARVDAAPWAERLIFSLPGPIRHQRRKQLFRLAGVNRRRLLLDRQTELRGAFTQLFRPDEQKPQVEPDDRGARESAGKRAETREGGGRIPLREVRNRRGGEDRGVVRREPRSRVELSSCGDPPVEAPEHQAVDE